MNAKGLVVFGVPSFLRFQATSAGRMPTTIRMTRIAAEINNSPLSVLPRDILFQGFKSITDVANQSDPISRRVTGWYLGE